MPVTSPVCIDVTAIGLTSVLVLVRWSLDRTSLRGINTMNSIDAFVALFIMLKLRVLTVKWNLPPLQRTKMLYQWSLKLLSAAAKAEISGGTHDTFVSTWSLTAPILWAVACVVVERAYYLAILSGPALPSIDGNLSVAVRYHHRVCATAASSCTGAASAGCCCHVKGLPCQVECRILIKAGRQQVLRQTTVLVELCKSIWLAGVGQLSFKFGNLKM